MRRQRRIYDVDSQAVTVKAKIYAKSWRATNKRQCSGLKDLDHVTRIDFVQKKFRFSLFLGFASSIIQFAELRSGQQTL